MLCVHQRCQSRWRDLSHAILVSTTGANLSRRAASLPSLSLHSFGLLLLSLVIGDPLPPALVRPPILLQVGP
jgi:hypothetical protein